MPTPEERLEAIRSRRQGGIPDNDFSGGTPDVALMEAEPFSVGPDPTNPADLLPTESPEDRLARYRQSRTPVQTASEPLPQGPIVDDAFTYGNIDGIPSDRTQVVTGPERPIVPDENLAFMEGFRSLLAKGLRGAGGLIHSGVEALEEDTGVPVSPFKQFGEEERAIRLGDADIAGPLNLNEKESRFLDLLEKGDGTAGAGQVRRIAGRFIGGAVAFVPETVAGLIDPDVPTGEFLGEQVTGLRDLIGSTLSVTGPLNLLDALFDPEAGPKRRLEEIRRNPDSPTSQIYETITGRKLTPQEYMEQYNRFVRGPEEPLYGLALVAGLTKASGAIARAPQAFRNFRTRKNVPAANFAAEAKLSPSFTRGPEGSLSQGAIEGRSALGVDPVLYGGQLDVLTRQASTFTRPADVAPAFQGSPVAGLRDAVRANREPFGEPTPVPVEGLVPKPSEIPTPFSERLRQNEMRDSRLAENIPSRPGESVLQKQDQARIKANEEAIKGPRVKQQQIIEQAQTEASGILKDIKKQAKGLRGKTDQASVNQRAELSRQAKEVRSELERIKSGKSPKTSVAVEPKGKAPEPKSVPKVDIAPKTPEPVKARPVEPVPKAPIIEPTAVEAGKKVTEPRPATIEDLGKNVIETKSIKTDEARFQNRPFENPAEKAIFDKRVDELAGKFKPGKTDIVVWKDPKTGEFTLLGGHHQLAAAKKIGEKNLPVEIFKGTEAEAKIKAAETNRADASRSEGLQADIKVFKDFKKAGVTPEKITANFGDQARVNLLESLSRLDTKGKFMQGMVDEAVGGAPHLKRWARNVGDLRKQFPELTGRHEQQIFDQLYPKDKATKLYDNLTKDKLFELVENQVSDLTWKSEHPIKLTKSGKPPTGHRASPNESIRKLQARVDEIDGLIKKAKTAGEKDALMTEKARALKDMHNADTKQGGLFDLPQDGTTLGFMGVNPQIFNSLGTTGKKLVMELQKIKKSRSGAQPPPPPRIVYRSEPKIPKAKSAPADLTGVKFDSAPASATSTKGVGKNAGTNYKTFWKDIVGRDGIERQYRVRVSDKGKVTVVEKGADSKAQVARDAKNSQVVKNMHFLPERFVTRASINLSLETVIRTMERLGPEAKELFYRPYDKAADRAVRKHRKVSGVFHKLVKENQRSNSSQRIYDYATLLQKGGKKILADMGITKIPKLTPGEMKLYNYMRSELELRFIQVNKARVASGLEAFNKVENYFTFFRNLEAMERAGYSIQTTPVKAVTDAFVKKADTPFGFAKNRGIDGEVILARDAFGVFEKYNEAAFYHQEMTPVVSRIRRLLEMDHGNGWRLMERNPEAYDALSQWINHVAGETKTIIPKVVMRKIRKLQGNLTFAILAGNLRSAGIQPVAMVNTVALIGPKYSLIGSQALFDPIKRSIIIKKSNLLGRQYEVAVVEAFDGALGKLGWAKQKVGKALLEPLRFMDMETAQATWYGAYQRGLKKLKMSDRGAVNYANDIVNKSQASARSGDVAPIQRTDVGKVFTHLQTFVINEWGMLRRDILGGVDARTMTKTEVSKRLSGYITGAILVNILYEDGLGIQSPFPTPINAYQEEMERSGDMLEASKEVGLEFLSQVPIIGGALQYGSSPFGPTANLVQNVIDKTSGGFGYTKPWWQLAGEATGVPGTSQIAKEFRGSPGSVRGLLTTRISRSDGKKDRGKWRTRILDLLSKDKFDEASKIMKEWNENFPDYEITMGDDARKDVGFNAVESYLSRKATSKFKKDLQ